MTWELFWRAVNLTLACFTLWLAVDNIRTIHRINQAERRAEREEDEEYDPRDP